MKSTRQRMDDKKQTRQAQRMADEYSSKEAKVGPDNDGAFRSWVPDYIANHYVNKPKSLKRYQLAWARICEWCRAFHIEHPAAVRYQHAQEFMDWRKAQGASQNTARLELKFFSFVMQEAMRREYTEKNPLSLAKIQRAKAAEKKELTGEDFAAARTAFSNRTGAPWMLTVFEICAHLGCRFNEAEFGPEVVDFKNMLVRLTDSKRQADDPRKNFTVPLTPALAKHLRVVFENRQRTAPPISASGEHNRQFNKTLKAACGATSHSLRVSFITRCHRAGLTESQAMRLVNHSTRLVHSVYTKLNIEDARAAAALVPPPAPPEILAPSGRRSSSRKKGIPAS